MEARAYPNKVRLRDAVMLSIAAGVEVAIVREADRLAAAHAEPF